VAHEKFCVAEFLDHVSKVLETEFHPKVLSESISKILERKSFEFAPYLRGGSGADRAQTGRECFASAPG
jgi:hypothetical protein